MEEIQVVTGVPVVVVLHRAVLVGQAFPAKDLLVG
jgi:hypothetical protein